MMRKYFINKDFSAIGKSDAMVGLDYEDCVQYYNKHFNLQNTVLFTHGDINPLKHI